MKIFILSAICFTGLAYTDGFMDLSNAMSPFSPTSPLNFTNPTKGMDASSNPITLAHTVICGDADELAQLRRFGTHFVIETLPENGATLDPEFSTGWKYLIVKLVSPNHKNLSGLFSLEDIPQGNALVDSTQLDLITHHFGCQVPEQSRIVVSAYKYSYFRRDGLIGRTELSLPEVVRQLKSGQITDFEVAPETLKLKLRIRMTP